MTTFNDRFPDNLSDLIAKIETLADAGVDAAFDCEMEELERQFAELRFVGNN